jgi:pyruvate/2-oxoglutarate dehydrogenase complex dihydrolipoamide acyltransferase (E2) component
VIACLGQAVETDRSIQAYRNWRNQLIIFDDVDVLTYIEIEVDGQRFPLAHVVRAVNRKSWREIHEEIRGVQANAGETPNARRRESAEWFLLLPAFARNVIYRIVNRSPRIWKKYVGTVYLTAVGMFGTGGGWGIGFSAHTLGVIIGGICEKPVAVKGRVEIRECLNLTADFDHDLTDGAPAARFIDKFKEFLERDIRSTILG